jgi:hypothetical protein
MRLNREMKISKFQRLFFVAVVTIVFSSFESCSSSQQVLRSIRVEAPVYNAVFSPTAPHSPAVVLDGKQTSVRFFIGARNANSAITSESWTVNREILANKTNVPLVVTIVCPFCTNLRENTHPITYFGEKHESSEAQFNFVPILSKISDLSGLGKIAFQVTHNGIQTDYVTVNVKVVKGLTKSTEAITVEQPALTKPAEVRQPGWSRPIDLVLKVRADGNLLQIQLQPGNDEVTTLFGGKQLSTDGKGDYRWFKTGMLVTDIPGTNASLYSDIFATVNANDKLKAMLGGTQQLPAGALNDILLSENDKKILLKPFFDAGGRVYRQLFVTGTEADLRDLMSRFRKYSRNDRTVRVKIETDGIYLPWQILVPSGSTDPQELWGFRYEISVNPTGIILPGPYQGPMTYQSGPLLFGKYRSTNVTDIVAKLGDMESIFLKSNLTTNGVAIADSRDSFLNQLTQSRDAVQIILTFTHGLSGTIIKDDGSVMEYIGGPRLQFADNEFVPAKVLNDILGSIPDTEVSMFHNAPLVFLNGCETGTAGYYATTNLDFGGTFLRMGSRGVIVTEAPVWTYFGYNFGISLLKQLKTGDSVPDAILTIRRQYLEKTHNPLGLLYTYYGGPDVKVNFQ